MTPAELDRLAARASAAGYDSIASYCLVLEEVHKVIASAESGWWGRLSDEALRGRFKVAE